MLPGIFSDGAPQDIQDEQATMMSEFHPVGFRLMSISSAETDTTRRHSRRRACDHPGGWTPQ
jgi:hypothetical protein